MLYFDDLERTGGNKKLHELWHHISTPTHYDLILLVTSQSSSLKLEQLECLHSEIPPAIPLLPIPVIHIRSQVKRRQSHSNKILKNFEKFKFWNLQETLHMTHLVMFLDKMYKYEKYPIKTVGATERTLNVGQPDTGSETNIPPNHVCCAEGIIKEFCQCNSEFIQVTSW